MLKKLKSLVTAPFRKLNDVHDRRPSGSQIRQYAAAIKAATANHEVILVCPEADKLIAKVAVEAENDEQRLWFAKGYSASLEDIAGIRRSTIKPTLKLHKTALKAHKKEAKAEAKLAKAQEERSPVPPVTAEPAMSI